jgi:hypothetical protein
VRSTSEIPQTHSIKHEGFGGFPGPFDLIHDIFKRAAPLTYRRVERSMTIPSMTTLEEKKTPWLNFNGLVVGRNSDFRTDTLTAEQIEQIGGTEYRALEMLSWMVPAVCFCVFLLARLCEGGDLLIDFVVVLRWCPVNWVPCVRTVAGGHEKIRCGIPSSTSSCLKDLVYPFRYSLPLRISNLPFWLGFLFS